MQRTFIALKIIPEKEMMDCIYHLQDALRNERIKWVDPGKLHITLQFLGDTSPSLLTSTTRILEKTVPCFPAPEVEFKGLGVFRNIRDPRVIWIGMEPGPVLPALKARIEEELIPFGFTPENRKFRPHLTLGRIKTTRDRPPPSNSISGRNQNSYHDQNPRKITGILKELLNRYGDVQFQKNRIGELTYYESILRPEGPEYLPLREVLFSG